MTKNVTKLEEWQLIDWQKVGEHVQKLRSRIFEVSRAGRKKELKNLQKLMLRSRSNWLLAIRRVTQINKGRRTPGVDREIITRPEERIALFYWLEGIRLNNWQPPPTRRVEIPKGGGKTRALGIPTIRDRVIQAIVKNALEPEWEAVFEATSYGFRPGRSAHDAIVSIWSSYSGWGTKHKEWILDADIKGAFDHISHDYLLAKLGHFPAKPLINKWLKAGVMVGLDLSPTITGTPQGGIISPVLANIALHGMEDALGIVRTASGVQRGAHKVVRYADDFVVLCQSRTAAEAAWAKLQVWLAQAGLEMSEEKTKIINIWDGVDFLGFTIRMSKTGSKARGFSVYTKPSRKSMEKFKTKVRDIFNRGRHKQPDLLLKELNPLIVGWAMYFRMGTSAKAFSTLDSFLWHRTWRYARYRHPRKGKRWLKQKYYTSTVRKDGWTFYDAETGINIRSMVRIGIRRHTMVKGNASPDDPVLVAYWAARQKKPQGLNSEQNQLWLRQKGQCPRCKQGLAGTEAIHIDHINGNCHDDRWVNKQLLHETCHHQKTVASRRQQMAA